MTDLSDTAHADSIRHVIRTINECWLARRYAEIADHVAEEVVIAPPGSEVRLRGRDAYVQSYRDYDQAAKTHEFLPGEPQIDVTGQTAVAICPFEVLYELNGTRYRERGRDMLVFSRSTGEWRVVWRSMQTEPAAATPPSPRRARAPRADPRSGPAC
jgi:ketosteroid isomerase-like protein